MEYEEEERKKKKKKLRQRHGTRKRDERRGDRLGDSGVESSEEDQIPREPGRQSRRSCQSPGRAGDEEVPQAHDQGGLAQARQLQKHYEHSGGSQTFLGRTAQSHSPQQGKAFNDFCEGTSQAANEVTFTYTSKDLLD